MTTLNQQLETIKSFNNSVINSVDFFSWGGSMVKFESSKFALEGIEKALNIKVEKLESGEFMFVSMLPNVA